MATLAHVPGQLIEQIEGTLGLSELELAQALRSNPRTVERWKAGSHYPQRDARERLAALEALTQHLTRTFATSEAIGSWVHTPSRYLAGLTPAEVLLAGRIDRVEAALEALDSGFFV